MVPPVFKTGLAGITLAGEFDSLPPPPSTLSFFPGTTRNYYLLLLSDR